MSTSQKTVDFITDQIVEAGDIRSRKMFGEFALYCGEKVVAFVCDDTLFVKITPSGRQLLKEPKEGLPYPGARPYFQIDGELLENREELTQLIRVTAQALPRKK